jgi:hypothetical protein
MLLYAEAARIFGVLRLDAAVCPVSGKSRKPTRQEAGWGYGILLLRRNWVGVTPR